MLYSHEVNTKRNKLYKNNKKKLITVKMYRHYSVLLRNGLTVNENISILLFCFLHVI